MNIVQTIPLADTWMHGGWGWMSLMMIPMLLFWGAVIFGIGLALLLELIGHGKTLGVWDSEGLSSSI